MHLGVYKFQRELSNVSYIIIIAITEIHRIDSNKF